MTITLPSILLNDAPVDHPAATPEQNALLAWAAAHKIERATIPLNGNKQYHAVHPIDGGKPKGRTRCSTFAGTLDDGAGLVIWRNGMLVKGIGMAPNLASAAADAVAEDDVKLLRSIAATALQVGGEKLAADVGTALHLACEWTQEPDDDARLAADIALPDTYRADITAFTNMLTAHGLTVVHVERNVFTPSADTVGRFDYLVTGPWGDELRVLDVKTGSKHDRIASAVQLALLANASHMWDGEEWQPAPPVCTDVAYIAHMPAGTGTCDLVAVDIAAGWELVELSIKVRAARSATTLRPMFTVLEAPAQLDLDDEQEATFASSEQSTTILAADAGYVDGNGAPMGGTITITSLNDDLTTERTAWIDGRLQAIAAINDKRGVEAVRKYWPTDTPARPPWTETHIDHIDKLLTSVEVLDEVPFTATDPTKPDANDNLAAKRARDNATIDAAVQAAQQAPTWPVPDNGGEVDGDQIAPIAAHVNTLPDEARQLAATWSTEGKNQQRPWGRTIDGLWSERTYAINLAAMRCIEHLYDDDSPSALTRAALSLVIGEDVQPSWLTGAILGSLTLDEAERLEELAQRFGAGDNTTTCQLGAIVTRLT